MIPAAQLVCMMLTWVIGAQHSILYGGVRALTQSGRCAIPSDKDQAR